MSLQKIKLIAVDNRRVTLEETYMEMISISFFLEIVRELVCFDSMGEWSSDRSNSYCSGWCSMGSLMSLMSEEDSDDEHWVGSSSLNDIYKKVTKLAVK